MYFIRRLCSCLWLLSTPQSQGGARTTHAQRLTICGACIGALPARIR